MLFIGSIKRVVSRSRVEFGTYLFAEETRRVVSRFIILPQANDALARPLAKARQTVFNEARETLVPPKATGKAQGQDIRNIQLVEDEVL